jgi:hypothetical protein
MGLSIHYSGSFNPNSSLPALIEEVQDIATFHKWKYKVFEQTFPENSSSKEGYTDDIYGICFTPPKSETVWICFLSNGKMSSPTHLAFFGEKENQEERPYLYMLSTKTQFAGINTHKLIIHLLKYLGRKYLNDLKVADEGHYWETGDEKLLEDTYKEYNELLETFATSIEIFPMKEGESYGTYFERLLVRMQNNKMRKKKKK